MLAKLMLTVAGKVYNGTSTTFLFHVFLSKYNVK